MRLSANSRVIATLKTHTGEQKSQGTVITPRKKGIQQFYKVALDDGTTRFILVENLEKVH